VSAGRWAFRFPSRTRPSTRRPSSSRRACPHRRDAGISDEEVLELLRILGRGLGQAAESLRALPLKLVLEPGITETELAQQYALAAERLYPLVNPLVENILALHLRHATQSTVVSAMERQGGCCRLAGGRGLLRGPGSASRGSARELAPASWRLAARLEALPADVVEAPVRSSRRSETRHAL